MQRNNINFTTPASDKKKISITIGKCIYSSDNSKIYQGKANNETSETLAIKSLSYNTDINIYLCEREIDILKTIANADLSYLIKISAYYTELKIDYIDDDEVRMGHCYIAMPFFEKGTLDDWLTRITPEQQFKITIGTLTGIKHMHQLGIIHRDLKPENILLDDNMEPVISDFGSSAFEESAVLNDVRGTDLFMSPQVLLAYFRNMDYTQSKADDMYSFSVLCWCIYAQNQSPFIRNFYSYLDDQNAVDDLIKHIVDGTKRDNIPNACPPSVAELIHEGWDNNPKNRPTAEIALSRIGSNGLFASSSTGVPIINITDENNITSTYHG